MKGPKKKFKQIAKKLYLNLAQAYYSVAGNKVECNVCHFKANKFRSGIWHLYSLCPKCGSQVRQRLLMASLTYLDDFNFNKIFKDKNVLHFAPEKSFGELIQKAAKTYKTADFFGEGYSEDSYDKIDYNLDISDMKEIKNESFDCVIACDVLEHVPAHINGIKEVYRVLNRGGYCILTVPQKDHLAVTFEDPSITDPKEREKTYGQFNHLRIYGDDFVDMLKDNGFEVTAVNETFFDKKIVEKYVLFPPVLSKHPLATNYRKVFFGKKI